VKGIKCIKNNNKIKRKQTEVKGVAKTKNTERLL
jgi:hypothetical protein